MYYIYIYIIYTVTDKIRNILSTSASSFLLPVEKKKRQVRKVPKPAYGQLWGIQIQKEVKYNPNSQAVKKVCSPQKGYGEKRCEIQGGGQEMAVMVG